MTHLTDPWIKARLGLDKEEPSNRIIDLETINNFADKICLDYNINNEEDLKKYSDKLFTEVMNNLDI